MGIIITEMAVLKSAIIMVMDTRVTNNCVNPNDSLQCCKKCAVPFGAAADGQTERERDVGREGKGQKDTKTKEDK